MDQTETPAPGEAPIMRPLDPKLRDAVIAHPTMAEGLGPLFSNVPPLSAN
jgi:hypothetical protein